MKDKLEVIDTGYDYRVGEWSFDESDKNLAYIDSAIDAWIAWRDYVKRERDDSTDEH